MSPFVHTAIFTGLSLLLALPLVAREETGDVLASLVESVDTKLANLETSMQQQEQTQTVVKDELQELVKRYRDSDDQQEQIALKSQIIKGWSELNTNDRLLIAQSLDTILSVDDDLQRLKAVFEDGVMGPERLNQQRNQIRQVILGVGPLLSTLSQSLEDPRAQTQAATTEQTLVLLYQQLEVTSANNSEGMLNQIQATTDALEEVAAQLAIVQNLLEMERYQLEVASQVSITELLFARLGNARFGDRELIQVPQAFQDGVAQRNKAFGDILNSSSLTDPASSRTRTDEAILRKIRNANLPD